MEKQIKHHEILRPLREIVAGVGEFVVDKAVARVIPSTAVELPRKVEE